ncbi:MAG: hypothetical protein IJ025_08045 [Clostridia bacterium]|nr:hypothetical protein [Clostridia bacterium]
MENDLKELYSCYKYNLGDLPENLSEGYFLNPENIYTIGGTILFGQEPNGWSESFDSYAKGIDNIINNQKKTRFCQKIKMVREQGGLINNIAKFALNKNGKHPPISQQDDFWRKMYEKFEFRGEIATIYQHELKILKPNKILLLCGPGRKRAVEIAFQFENGFIDNFVPRLNKDKCANQFEYNDITFMYALHPQAHMNAETRKEYDTRIENFLKNEL